MYKLKSVLSTTGAVAVLTLGLAAPVAALTGGSQGYGHDGRGGKGGDNTTSITTDNSNQHNTALTVNGNCSGIIQTNVDQNQSSSSDNSSDQGSGSEGSHNNNSDSQSNSTNQSQSADVVFSPNCSTTNVTQVAAAPVAAPAVAPAAAPQVVAPTGGVHAGGGAGVSSSITTSLVGLTGSLGSLGLGVVLRGKRGLLNLF